ncbi:MAG: MBL fold metallo-hydrolase [Candidatus Firestonebacteria bacterium]
MPTHAHFDHIGADKELKEKTGADLLIHKEDSTILKESLKILSKFGGKDIMVEPDKLLKEGDIVNVGRLNLEVIHTPGHTPGGICIKIEDVVFCGDTLFKGGMGRYDFPFASYEDLINSIKKKLFILPDDTMIYPGHGDFTTIGEERKNNPFLMNE